MRDSANTNTGSEYEMLDESVLKVVKFYDDNGDGSSVQMLKSKLTTVVYSRGGLAK